MRIIRAGGEYLRGKESKAWTALSIVIAALVLGVAAQMLLGARSLWALPMAAGALLFLVPEAMHAIRTIRRRLRAVRKGRLGERLTTELVSRLPDDYYLINDITFGGGNVDHIVVGPCGIVAIETKRVAGEIRCDGDQWTINGRPVKSYSKQAKAGAMAIRSLLATSPDLGREYVEAVVVLNDPHCRLKINRAQVAVVRFSELLALIAAFAKKRQMAASKAEAIVRALSLNRFESTSPRTESARP